MSAKTLEEHMGFIDDEEINIVYTKQARSIRGTKLLLQKRGQHKARLGNIRPANNKLVNLDHLPNYHIRVVTVER